MSVSKALDQDTDDDNDDCYDYSNWNDVEYDLI